MSAPQHLVVIGQGYVGLPLAVRAVEVGFVVTGVDTDERRVEQLLLGQSYIEDISAKHLATALATGRFRVCTKLPDGINFDIAVIAVPTPLRDREPDLSFIEQAARRLAPRLRRGATVILESTTYPGTTDEFLAPLLEAASGLVAGVDFFLGYSPERIDPGNRTWRIENTPKLVSGTTAESLTAVQSFYATIVDRTVAVSRPSVAELSKLLENTFRHVNIALINELAILSHELGIDVWEAVEAAATKPYGYMRFEPGPGVGGHCLPVDPTYLSWYVESRLGRTFRLIKLANDINGGMPKYVVGRVVQALEEQAKPIAGSRLLLLGMAYKKNTGDVRESPAVRIAESLANMGADVQLADPHVEPGVHPHIARAQLTPQGVGEADVVVILTDHDAFDVDLLAPARHVIDCRNKMKDADNVELL
ncbi:nucleotide sugar dehydrogenase [Streptomyces sp. WAC05858]|uniref:nucleotide sugar dehydrogenase n=1 Tax=Streptomyces TaxID=1883 RepID=UPI000F79073C|nr:nucleotide sugar dehydrogenase [Streptomyces sp. WAC05858]RSS35057.1 nucleotide sugar dehydrogenase [Streptomyces sp. WAC05858]WTB04021.1 nucleotide sugar dehydrogenase [Streptomyces antimycoticus]